MLSLQDLVPQQFDLVCYTLQVPSVAKLQLVWAVINQLEPSDAAARKAVMGDWALLPVMGGQSALHLPSPGSKLVCAQRTVVSIPSAERPCTRWMSVVTPLAPALAPTPARTPCCLVPSNPHKVHMLHFTHRRSVVVSAIVSGNDACHIWRSLKVSATAFINVICESPLPPELYFPEADPLKDIDVKFADAVIRMCHQALVFAPPPGAPANPQAAPQQASDLPVGGAARHEGAAEAEITESALEGAEPDATAEGTTPPASSLPVASAAVAAALVNSEGEAGPAQEHAARSGLYHTYPASSLTPQQSAAVDGALVDDQCSHIEVTTKENTAAAVPESDEARDDQASTAAAQTAPEEGQDTAPNHPEVRYCGIPLGRSLGIAASKRALFPQDQCRMDMRLASRLVALKPKLLWLSMT